MTDFANMGTITSSTGINSGIDIASTVSKLMAISSQPVTTLTNTDTTLTNQQTAVNALATLLLAVQNDTQALGQSSIWGAQSATSSDTSALTATVTGTPALGTYEYTPLQMAQSQQLLSNAFQSATSALGGGTLTFRYGNTVNQGVSLAEINGGQGFSPGEIRITDGNGATAVVNLSNAQSIDDVVQAINSAGTINVTASTDDGQLVLAGPNAAKIQVQEVGGGSTAKSLGLTSLTPNAAGTAVSGADIYTLASNIQLNALNDGKGVQMNPFDLGKFNYTLHDGTTGTIDLTQLSGDATISDVIQQINSQSSGKLQASLTSQGLVVADTTVTSSNTGKTFSIANATGYSGATASGAGQFHHHLVDHGQPDRRRVEHHPLEGAERRQRHPHHAVPLRRHRLHAAQRHDGHDRPLRTNHPGRRHPTDREPKRRQAAGFH